MAKIILITGAARSGKSEWAEALALESGKAVIYVATATHNPDDTEWCQRIQQHQNRRPETWVSKEVPIMLAQALANTKPHTCVLVDSLGTWVANLLEQDEVCWENTVREFLIALELAQADMLFVAEETGWGVVPAYPLGRLFRDRLGSLVRRLSRICETVYLVTGGHALNLSLLGTRLPDGTGNREQGTGNREQGIGNRE